MLLLLFLLLLRGQGVYSIVLLFMVLYAVLAFLLVWESGKQITAEVHGGDMIEKGNTMEMALKLTNRGRLPVFRCTCEAAAENLLTGETKHLMMNAALPPGNSWTEHFTLTDQNCGKVSLSAGSVRISDPLQIFQFNRAVAEIKKDAGYFSPQLTGVHIPEEFLDSYNMESYKYSQYEKGSDPGEVFGIRDYQEGDSLRQIHWKLSAKLGTMTVKIPSFPIENNILVILDNVVEEDSTLSAGEKSRLIEHFCSLSAALLERKIPHSIGWYDTYSQVFCEHRLSSVAELWQTIPEVLSCRITTGEISSVIRYLEQKEGNGYTNHFIVTSGEGRDAQRLETEGAVRIFKAAE